MRQMFSTDITGKTFYHVFINEIILETHNGGDRVVVSKNDYELAESRDVIQLLPVDDKGEIRTFYKPYWKVVQE